jgi:aldehyde dehydrogenase (NAD+)
MKTSTRSRSPGRPTSANAFSEALAGTKKKLTLELGGKAPNIVFEDAPIDQAVEGIINGIYFNQGHVCCAGSRLSCRKSIVEPVIRKLRERIATLRVGNPLDKNTDVGAINSRMQLEKIQELVDSGVEEGAEMIQSSCKLPTRGYWFAPTFFTGVSQSYRIAQEEIFGPVLSVMTFRTPEEALEKANNTPYGLSAGVWTEKGSRILQDGAEAARRRRLGEHLQQIRSDRVRSAVTRKAVSGARAAFTASGLM